MTTSRFRGGLLNRGRRGGEEGLQRPYDVIAREHESPPPWTAHEAEVFRGAGQGGGGVAASGSAITTTRSLRCREGRRRKVLLDVPAPRR
jgi:hypothetical protein